MDQDPMWFFDDVPPEYRAFQKETQAVAREYLDLRQLLKAAQESLNATPEDAYYQAKVRYLQKRIKGLETKAPWLTTEQLKEFALWGVPH